ncbi:MAG: N-acetyltransferase family protein [Bacteroidaceae bacterium]|nr:N-acetyltransferase family protein [Bacteroidaceae bacterium]
MNNHFRIRVAEDADARACHDIYGSYVHDLIVTFTIDNPSVEEYLAKIRNTKLMYPFYVAEDSDGRILGYCCGEPLRPHDAYKWNVEWTIVLAPSCPRRQGIGRALFQKFEQTLRAQGFQYIYAVIVDTNTTSLAFHHALGFNEVGHFPSAGLKQGRWLGIKWLNKFIGNTDTSTVHDPIPFSQL